MRRREGFAGGTGKGGLLGYKPPVSLAVARLPSGKPLAADGSLAMAEHGPYQGDFIPHISLSPQPCELLQNMGLARNECIPFVEFKIGDIVLDEDTGKKMRIITRQKLLGELKTGRFQFASHPRNWYAAYMHGCETLYYAVDPSTSPFGKGNPEHLDIKFPETKVNALTFEEVVDEPIPA